MPTISASDAATSSAPVTHWLRADRQGSIDMAGCTASEALRTLLSQCGDDDQRAEILAGDFELAQARPANGSMNRDEKVATMLDIFRHRIEGEPTEQRGWLIWSSALSDQTLAKFVERAKRAGVPGVWARSGKVGCRA